MKKYLIGLCFSVLSLASMAQLPPTQSDNGISYIEGGVGLDESMAIQKDQKAWPLLLQFSQQNGNQSEWISGVLLVIKDASGLQVLSHQVDGPMILLGLKPGKYSITSTYGTQRKVTNADVVSGQHQKMTINWK